MERTRFEVVGHRDDAVDLGRLAVATPDPRGVDEHFDPRTDQFVTFSFGDAVLQLTQLGEPVVHEGARHLAVEPRRVRAVLP